MPKYAIVFGLILVGLGLWGYFGSTSQSPSMTALLPAWFGLALVACGAVGTVDSLRKHAMHIAATVGLLGLLGAGGRGLAKVGVLFSDDPDGNSRAVLMTLIMAVVCLIYLVLSIKSFVAARRRQRAAEEAN